MAQDFGNGVSRTLSAQNRQFQVVVWQANKPPLDSELNLVAQVDWERQAEQVRSKMHSGFIVDPMQSDKDFQTNINWSNWFKFGRPDPASNGNILYANVNGWILPVVGTGLADGDESNRINLFPPPTTDSRIDFVFLEVFQAQVAPNPSTQNKPSASTIWKFGNVEFGGTNISDDLEDPTIGFETTERVQLQYRIRVVGGGAGLGTSVDLAQYPDGLEDPNVVAQGTASSPLTAFAWTNMKDELGDPGLWRAGNGDPNNSLGTVDGYSYAIPICAIFRRNSSTFVARIASGNANQMGALERNPPPSSGIVNRIDGTRTFSPVTLTSDLSPGVFGTVSVTGLSGSGLDNPLIDWAEVFLVIDEEIVGISSVNTGAGTITISNPISRQGRGRWGTQDTFHSAGSELKFFNFRPDGKFADEIAPTDILDLRRTVTDGEWDYATMLKHNLNKLFKGELRSSYKQGSNTDTQGVQYIEVDSMMGYGTGALPNQTERVDGFDGIRTHFSDGVVVQRGVTVLLNPNIGGSNPAVVNDFTLGAGDWEAGADFAVSGIQPHGQGWEPGTVIELWIGGISGNNGARGTTNIASENKFMRFVSPIEYEKELADGIRSNAYPSMTAAVNMQFPWNPAVSTSGVVLEQNTRGPIIPNIFQPETFFFLGGIANANLASNSAIIHSGTSPDGLDEIEIPGFNFADFATEKYFSPDALSTLLPTELLLYGRKNLFDVISNGGKDISGSSSELFVVVKDTLNSGNTGLYKVVGGGIGDYLSTSNASASDRLVISAVSTGGAIVDGATVIAQCRTPYTNTEDGPTSSSLSAASAVIVLGDLSIRTDYVSNGINQQMILSLSLAYGPSRGATARVADKISRLAVVDPVTTLLREPPSVLDPAFDNESGVPENEVYFPVDQNPQVWNHLVTKGAYPPVPMEYWNNLRYLTDSYRESEVFVDEGSKTVIFRPFQKLSMSMFQKRLTDTYANLPTYYDDGVTVVDGAGIVIPPSLSNRYTYACPLDYMPKFGRQDIPVRKATGSQPILFGINHLFCDEIGSTSNSSLVYKIIGGPNKVSGGVAAMLLTTESSYSRTYGAYGAITGGSAYQGRLYEDLNARSSDIQKRLRGIQLPPFLGIARVYGIYDARDWNANAGSSAFNTDRATLKTTGSRAKNLIRTDAEKQTLWILKDGASDVIASSGAHTYMIPEEVINIQLSPEYVSGEQFQDLEYVVEMEVFVFAQGFIDQNNLIFARKYDGAGNEYSSANPAPAGTSNPVNIYSINMILPAAMRGGHQGYIAYERTPYQGDPYMTRDGETLQPADYEQRYGSVTPANAFELATPIQQFYPDNTQTPEHVNCRTLEVLATVDFWTTMGTGKIGGPVVGNTVLDGGFLEYGSKIPSSSTSNPKQPKVRAFTEQQSEVFNLNYGQVSIVITDYSSMPANFNITLYENGYPFTTSISKGVSAIDALDNIKIALSSNVVFQKYNVFQNNNELVIQNRFPGKQDVYLTLYSTAALNGIRILQLGSFQNQQKAKIEGMDIPMNACRTPQATTPIRFTGSIERLPLGILMQDSDFIGEDPIRTGETLSVKSGGTTPAKELKIPLDPSGKEYGRIQNSGFIGMADGSILRYTPYRQGISDTGTKRFRLFRGGGSLYVLDPQTPGGPVDFSAGGFSGSEQPVVKGNVLVGRAYLIRNYQEEAFTGSVTRTYGGEIQMVIATYAVTGDGPVCEHGYALEGYLSPTGWGEGYGASDRYRLEGKPLYQPGSEIGPDCDIFIAPYPSEDPIDDPCA